MNVADHLPALQAAWVSICGGELALLESAAPDEPNGLQLPITVNGQIVAWLLGRPEKVSKDTAGRLIRSWGSLLESALSSAHLTQGLTNELIAAWDRLNFLHEVTGLMRTTADASKLSIEALKLAGETIRAQTAFIWRVVDDDINARFVGKAIPSDLLWPMVDRMQSSPGMLICNNAKTCRTMLPGASTLNSLMSQQLAIRSGPPTFVGLFNKKEGHFSAGDVQIFESLIDQLTTVLDIEALHEQQLKNEQINRDLELAAEVQTSFLPETLPVVEGYQISAKLVSASEIGGDFYDVARYPGSHTGIVVCDVAGKGISAALLASDVRSAIRHELAQSLAPGHVLTQANRHLYDDMNRIERFATAMLLSLPEGPGQPAYYANAGHATGLWLRADSRFIHELPSLTLPLGVMPAIDNTSVKMAIAPGDTVVLYSDGLTEAEDSEGKILGIDTIKDALRTVYQAPVKVVAQSMCDLRDQHRGRSLAVDDLTIVVIKQENEKATEKVYYEPMHLSAQLSALDIVHKKLAQVKALLPKTGQADRWFMELRLALVEAITNIIVHAHEDRPGYIHGLFTLYQDHLSITLSDRGTVYQAPAYSDSDFDLLDVPEGGYGMRIIQQVMDEVQYERIDEINHWRFVRHLPDR